MSHQSHRPLLVGDSVMVYIDDPTRYKNNARTGFGWIRFIGFIPSLGSFTQSIGVELIEHIHDGTDGTINNTQYFNVETGHGIIIPITNIIQVLSTNDIMLELRKTIHLLQERNDYIERLEAIISCKKDYLPPTPLQPKLTSINIDLQPIPLSNHSTFNLSGAITPITPNSPTQQNEATIPDSPDTVIYSPNTPTTPSCSQPPRFTLQQQSFCDHHEVQRLSVYEHVLQRSSVCEPSQRVSVFGNKLKRPSLQLSICEPISQQSSVTSSVCESTSRRSSLCQPQFQRLPIYGDNTLQPLSATSATSQTSYDATSHPTSTRSSLCEPRPQHQRLSVFGDKLEIPTVSENKSQQHLHIKSRSNSRLSVSSTMSESLSLSFESTESSCNSSALMEEYTPISYAYGSIPSTPMTPMTPFTPFTPTTITSPRLIPQQLVLYQSYEEENDVDFMLNNDDYTKLSATTLTSRLSSLHNKIELKNNKCGNKKKRKSKSKSMSKSKSKRKIRQKSMSQNY